MYQRLVNISIFCYFHVEVVWELESMEPNVTMKGQDSQSLSLVHPIEMGYSKQF